MKKLFLALCLLAAAPLAYGIDEEDARELERQKESLQASVECQRALEAPLELVVTDEQRTEAALHWQLAPLLERAEAAAHRAIAKFHRVFAAETAERAGVAPETLAQWDDYEPRQSTHARNEAETLIWQVEELFSGSAEMAYRVEAAQTLLRTVAFEGVADNALDEFYGWLTDRLQPTTLMTDAVERLDALKQIITELRQQITDRGLPVHVIARAVGEIIGSTGIAPDPVALEIALRAYEHAVRQSMHYELFISDVEEMRNAISSNMQMRWAYDDAVFRRNQPERITKEVLRAFRDAMARMELQLVNLHYPEGHHEIENAQREFARRQPNGAIAPTRVAISADEESIVDQELEEEGATSALARRRVVSPDR